MNDRKSRLECLGVSSLAISIAAASFFQWNEDGCLVWTGDPMAALSFDMTGWDESNPWVFACAAVAAVCTWESRRMGSVDSVLALVAALTGLVRASTIHAGLLLDLGDGERPTVALGLVVSALLLMIPILLARTGFLRARDKWRAWTTRCLLALAVVPPLVLVPHQPPRAGRRAWHSLGDWSVLFTMGESGLNLVAVLSPDLQMGEESGGSAETSWWTIAGAGGTEDRLERSTREIRLGGVRLEVAGVPVVWIRSAPDGPVMTALPIEVRGLRTYVPIRFLHRDEDDEIRRITGRVRALVSTGGLPGA